MSNLFSTTRKGFTLVELVVVTGIMSAIMLLVFFNGRKFNDGLALRTAGDVVASTLRRAQNFGISVREVQLNSGSFSTPYGVAFDLSTPRTIFLYADTNNNRAYNGTFACTGVDECKERFYIQRGIVIQRVCATYYNDTLTCFNGTNRVTVLTYVRPNPEPVIKAFDAGGSEIAGPWKKLYVELVSPKGTLLYVVTDSISGQITVQNTMP